MDKCLCICVSCHLVDVVGVDAGVEAHVQAVEHLHHLQRSAGRGDGGEAHDIREENGHLQTRRVAPSHL